MKKCAIALSLFALIFTGCKNDKKESKKEEAPTENTVKHKKDDDGLTVLSGEFIFNKDAAVINGNNFIYGVVLDSMATELSKKVEPLKRDRFDMVPVVIKGKIKPNPMKDGWDEVVKITKIITITKPKSKPAVEISGNNENKNTK